MKRGRVFVGALLVAALSAGVGYAVAANRRPSGWDCTICINRAREYDRLATHNWMEPVRVVVRPDAFVSPQGRILDRFEDVFIVRIGLTPAEHRAARQIADACRAGRIAIVSVEGKTSPPFVVSKVTNNADALIVTRTRDEAATILRDLAFGEFGE